MSDLVTGDTASSLSITCKDSAGQPIDLTGCTVKLHWLDENGVLKNPDMTISNAVNGIVTYQFGANEIFAPKMVFEVQITNSSGKILTSSNTFTLTVREQIG
jgi:hypothetical protein